MIAVDVSQLIKAALVDRHACRLAGIPKVDANSEVAAHVVGLANRLKDRHGAEAAMRAALTLWDVLEAGSGNSVH